jgi:nucleotide-binding universal stress UspA family protein
MTHAYSHLLLATEHSEQDAGAEALAFAMAQRCGLSLAAVLPIVSNAEYEALAPQLAAHTEAQAGQRIQALLADAQRAGIVLELQTRRGPEPYREIVDEARERGADLLVIRRRGKRGLLANLLVGEMVSQVVAQAPCSVLIAPRQAQMWSKQVIVAIDPLAPSEATVALAAGIAADCGQPLRVVCVAGTEAARAPAERVLAAVVQQARAIGAAVEGELRMGRAHHELIAAAKECGADLLVVARQRGDGLQRPGIGGTARKVIEGAECPVLVHVNSFPARGETT